MNWKTTGILLALLTLLGAFVLWQGAREAAKVHLVDERLFEGVEVSEVCELRIDNISRTHVVQLERDQQGIWYLTDPLAYPADGGLVQVLLEDVARGRMMAVSEGLGGATELGFDPPRAVLTVVACTPEGREEHTVEIGAADLDGKRVFVRKGGRYFRSLRRLATTVDREVEDFRSPRIMHLAGREVVEFHRTGSVQWGLDEPPADLGVHAYLEGGVWHSLLPHKARLDPMDVGVVVFGAVRLEVERFIEDEAPDLARYGLDRPLVRLSLGLSDGGSEVLLLSRLGNSSRWYVMLEGMRRVWSIDDQAALRLLYPFEALVETHFMTVRRGDVTALVLTSEERELRLERGPRDWRVRERTETGESSEPLRADGRLVDDWLAKLETLELAPFDWTSPGELSGSSLAIHVEVGEQVQGGQIGAPLEDGRTFQRDDEEVRGVVPEWAAELAAMPLQDILSLELLTLDEVEQVGLILTLGEESRSYRRDGQGIWRQEGAGAEAVELTPVLDPLLFLRAERYLSAGIALEEPVTVTFEDYRGGTRSYRVGRAREGDELRSAVSVGGSLALTGVPDLHGRLLDVLGR